MTNMGCSFDHVDIMNSVLSLAYNLESYPNHLYVAGYSISRIEPRFAVNGGVNPDILFISGGRGLFAECKGGEYYTGENLRRYNSIHARHLIEKGIDIPTDPIELDVGIFGREAKLQELFAERVEIKGSPLIILKFSENSPLKKIAPHIFQALLARSVSGKVEFTTRELTEEVMGDIWENLDGQLKKTLSNKVGQFLRRCRNEHLRPYLSKREEIWRVKVKDYWKSRKRFSEDCQGMIRNLDQTSLYDFMYR